MGAVNEPSATSTIGEWLVRFGPTPQEYRERFEQAAPLAIMDIERRVRETYARSGVTPDDERVAKVVDELVMLQVRDGFLRYIGLLRSGQQGG